MMVKPSATMLHAGIREAYEIGVRDLASIENVRLVAEPTPDSSYGKNEGAPRLLAVDGQTWLAHSRLHEEVFGPSSLLVACACRAEMLEMAEALDGNLTATLHGTDSELADYRDLVTILERKVGRLIVNAYPTGVEVCHAMVHGGPYPATTEARATSVGTAAMERFLRPVCYQGFPASLLPEPLADRNTLGVWRMIDGVRTQADVESRP